MERWDLTETIAISKFNATCLAELQRLHTTGQTVRMTRRGEPIADIVPPGPPERSEGWPGAMSDRIRGDITVPSSELVPWDIEEERGFSSTRTSGYGVSVNRRG